MHTETIIIDRDGSFLPDNAIGTNGALYADVAFMQSMRDAAYRLANRAYDNDLGFACEYFRDLMTERAEERVRSAYDSYLERCKGIQIITTTRYSQYGEGHSSTRIID